MLRKLIVLAVTSGLAKKAYDYYQQQHAAATQPKAGKPAARRTPRAKASAKPDAKPQA